MKNQLHHININNNSSHFVPILTHLADAYIQSDLGTLCLKYKFYQLFLSLGIKSMNLKLLVLCSTIWATATHSKSPNTCQKSLMHKVIDRHRAYMIG